MLFTLHRGSCEKYRVQTPESDWIKGYKMFRHSKVVQCIWVRLIKCSCTGSYTFRTQVYLAKSWHYTSFGKIQQCRFSPGQGTVDLIYSLSVIIQWFWCYANLVYSLIYLVFSESGCSFSNVKMCWFPEFYMTVHWILLTSIPTFILSQATLQCYPMGQSCKFNNLKITYITKVK